MATTSVRSVGHRAPAAPRNARRLSLAAIGIVAVSVLPDPVTAQVVADSGLLPPLLVQNVQVLNSPLTVATFTSDSPPINGFVPRVVFGLTDQQARSDYTFAAHPSTTPGGGTLPLYNTPAYFVATFDTGAQSHIISYDDSLVFNLDSAWRTGGSTATIVGASGQETADVTDALGIYMTALSNATPTAGGGITVTPGTMTGQWNTAILAAQEGSALPNIIGTPMMAQYQTVIRNSQTRRLTVGGQTLQSPTVSFQDVDTPVPSTTDYVHLSLELVSANGLSPDPVFIPTMVNYNNVADDPQTPTFWASPMARASASHTGGTITNEQFLFDTGAQVTVLSKDVAASVGFYSAGPNATPPDFFVEVLGVGGTTTQVPGFFLNNLSITTDGGPMTWTNVPVLVLNLPDPRDNTGYVPGILGMNLFTDRDLIVNGGLYEPWVGIGPKMTAEWTADASGSWGEDGKWMLGVPSEAGAPANFLSKATAPRTITVDANYTVGSIKFDNTNRYTLAGPGQLKLETIAGPAQIRAVKGSHTIAAPLALASNTTVTVEQAGTELVLSGGMTADEGKVLTVQQGKVRLAAAAGVVTQVGGLSLSTGATLDISDDTLVIDYVAGPSPADQVRQYVLNGRLLSSFAQADAQQRKGIAYVEASLVPTSRRPAGTDADALVVTATWLGDANADGMINADDYTRLDRGYQLQLTGWSNGDFNHDNTVTTADYLLIDRVFVQQTGVLSPDLLAARESAFGEAYVAALIAAVPEPTGIGLAVAAATLLSGRRRHRGHAR